MGRTACTEPQCLYKGALYLTFTVLLMFYAVTIHILSEDRPASSETCSNLFFFLYIIVHEMKIVCMCWSKLW